MAALKSALRPWAFTALAVCLFLPANAALAQVVYRWVDENGEVHYNATLPPEYATRPHQVLRNGIVVKSIEDPTALEPEEEKIRQETEQRDAQNAEQQKLMRADRLLVLKYQSEEEILDAMQVEIDNLAYDARLIEQSRVSAMSSLADQIKEAADRQRSGLPVEPEANKKIAQLRARIAQGKSSKASLDQREQQIRQLFNSELKRYRFLMEGGSPGAADPSEPVSESDS